MRIALAFLTALVCILVVAPGVYAAPLYNPDTGHWYELVDAYSADNPIVRDWHMAEANAVMRGGHLVTINNAAENTWLVNNFSNSVQWAAWTGLYQIPGSEEPAGGWGWISGETATYRNWHNGEPNNSDGGGENWGTIYLNFDINPAWNGYWNDAHFKEKTDDSYRYGIAEYNGSSVPEPATMALFSMGGLVMAFARGRKR